MDLFDPVLDRALSVDYDELAPEMRNRLGNGDLFFAVDGATDLHDLFWPWTDAVYARNCVPRKAHIDLMYQRNWSFCFDLNVVRKTLFPSAR